MLGKPVNSSSYPFGGRDDDTPESKAAVEQAGFRSACANFPGLVRNDTDRFQLPRFLMQNRGGELFSHEIAEWRAAFK